MFVRQAEPDDLHPIRAIVETAYSIYIDRMGRKPGPMHDDYAQRIGAREAWVAEYGGVVAGVLVLIEQPAGLLLDNIAVAPAAQGKGIGRSMLAFATAHARDSGYWEIRLYTHKVMAVTVAWYKRNGFDAIGYGAERGSGEIYMSKPIRRDEPSAFPGA